MRHSDGRPIASVVIPVRNGGDLFRVQLEALVAQQDSPAFEVIVSDNGSTDATVAIAESYADRLVLRVVDSSALSGVSHARNAGAASATTAHLLFCDADDKVSPHWVRTMTQALARDDIVGGPLELTELSEPAALNYRGTPPDDELPLAMRFLPYATGANMGVRRDVWASLGGFDTTFERGHEEVDFAWRAQLSGRTIGFAPEAVLHYRLRGSVRDTMRQTFHYGRTYSQLFARHREHDIPRTPWKREVRTYGILLHQGWRAWREGDSLDGWKCTMAWTGGRLFGDLKYRVRAPL